MEASVSPLEKSQLDRLVGNMPVGLLVEDEQGRIIWANNTFICFVSQTIEQLHGTKVSDLPLTRVPGAGGNPDYCRLMSPGEGGPEWLLCTWQQISQVNGRALIARFYLDATEHRRVRRFRGLQLSVQHSGGVIDQVTGTFDRAGITQMLEAEVSRSRRYHNPLAVVWLRLEIRTTAFEHHDIDRVMSAAARVLREQTRWVDRIGRWSEQEFLLVLPESDASAAGRLAEKIERYIAHRQTADEAEDLSSLTVCFGFAEWQRGDDVSNLIDRAEAALKAEGKVKASNR